MAVGVVLMAYEWLILNEILVIAVLNTYCFVTS
jgi:hypothetical protein